MQSKPFLTLAAATAAALLLPHPTSLRAAETPASPRPNVVLIITDDLGYHDLGFQGSADIPTPNLDALAKSGVKFTNAYVTAPICGASRAGLLSGTYQQRDSYETNPSATQGLNVNQATLANAFHDAGYATQAVGKWSVGQLPQFRPQQRGFDNFFGFLGMMHPYLPGPVDPAVRMVGGESLRSGFGDPNAPGARGFANRLPGEAPASRPAFSGANAFPGGVTGGPPVIGAEAGHFVRGNEEVSENGYATQAFAREAVSFIDHHPSSPFFLYLAFNASHSPLQPTQKYIDRFPTLTGKHQLYAATTSAMDDAVGQVVEELKKTGQEQNTIIAFINDNGGPPNDITANNAPLSGTKGTLWEGGIRVASFFRWPGHFLQDAVINTPIISLDYFPTLIQAANVPAPATKTFEGQSLLPLLAGTDTAAPAPRTLYWRFGQQWAIREGPWKLTVPQRNVTTPLLFNLDADLAENNDVAALHPDFVKHLTEEWTAWNAKNLPAPAGFGGARRPQQSASAGN